MSCEEEWACAVRGWASSDCVRQGGCVNVPGLAAHGSTPCREAREWKWVGCATVRGLHSGRQLHYGCHCLLKAHAGGRAVQAEENRRRGVGRLRVRGVRKPRPTAFTDRPTCLTYSTLLNPPPRGRCPTQHGRSISRMSEVIKECILTSVAKYTRRNSRKRRALPELMTATSMDMQLQICL